MTATEVREPVALASSARPHVSLFGRVRVAVAGGEREFDAAAFPSRKARHVFELLALAGGAPVSKDHLIEVNWGDRLPRHPAATLEHTVSILRTACAAAGIPPIVATVSGGYRLDTSVASIDLVRFEQLVRSAAHATPSDALRLLCDALALATGDVLENEPLAEWAIASRHDYRLRVERAALQAARLALASGEAEAALELAEHAQRVARLPSEDAYHLRASALLRLGRRTDSLVLLREAEQAVRQEYGAALAPATQALLDTLHAPQVSATLHPRRLALDLGDAVFPPGLPLVGRTRERSLVAALVRDVGAGSSAVLVFEGPAGIGKTRLLDETVPVDAGVRVCRLTCSPSGRSLPCFTAARVLRAIMGSRPAASPARGATSAASSATELYQALASLVANAGPTVVVLDDVHLADDESLTIIGGLAGADGVPGFGVVATRRPGRWDAGTQALQGRTVALPPLSAAEVATAGYRVDHRLTGGVPLVLAACAEAARERAVSAATLDALVRRAGEPGPLAHEVLVVLAAVGRPTSPGEIAFVLGLAPDLVEGVVDGLERHGLLAAVDGPDAPLALADLVTAKVLIAVAGEDRARAIRSQLRRAPVGQPSDAARVV